MSPEELSEARTTMARARQDREAADVAEQATAAAVRDALGNYQAMIEAGARSAALRDAAEEIADLIEVAAVATEHRLIAAMAVAAAEMPIRDHEAVEAALAYGEASQVLTKAQDDAQWTEQAHIRARRAREIADETSRNAGHELNQHRAAVAQARRDRAARMASVLTDTVGSGSGALTSVSGTTRL